MKLFTEYNLTVFVIHFVYFNVLIIYLYKFIYFNSATTTGEIQ